MLASIKDSAESFTSDIGKSGANKAELAKVLSENSDAAVEKLMGKLSHVLTVIHLLTPGKG